MKTSKKGLATLLLITSLHANAQQINGYIVDETTKEPLIGAIVEMDGTDKKFVADIDGKFIIEGLQEKPYTLYIKYMGYKTKTIKGVPATKRPQQPLAIAMKQD